VRADEKLTATLELELATRDKQSRVAPTLQIVPKAAVSWLNAASSGYRDGFTKLQKLSNQFAPQGEKPPRN